MMSTVLEHACRLEGVEQVLLAVTTTQEAAAKLYRSLGFESYGCEPRALKIGERYLDEEYLVLFARRRNVSGY
jgi:ribosomal protein S18 acetylase RimI-like enzyme